MQQKPDLEKRVDEAMDSLDGIQPASAGSWFYGRVMNRLKQDDRTSWSSLGKFLSRPAVAIAGLCLILFFNIALLVRQERETDNVRSAVAIQPEQGSDSESVLATNSSFDYENLVQQ